MQRGEFRIDDQYQYDHSGPMRWVISHLRRHLGFLIAFVGGTMAMNVIFAMFPVIIGSAFSEVTQRHPNRGHLFTLAVLLLGLVLLRGLADVVRAFSDEFLAKRVEREARDELYLSLLSKSQTFHNRQRVGDLMARAANDMGQISDMIVPGFDMLLDSLWAIVTCLIFIAVLKPVLLLFPVLFTVAFYFTLRRYTAELNPLASSLRRQFGELNAGLAETIEGIDVVKSSAQEERERQRFEQNARRYRDLFVQNGQVQAHYLPPLFLGMATAGAFVHGVLLVTWNQLSIQGLITYLGLLTILRFPAFISLFSFNLVQFGLAAARRIVTILNEEATIDEHEDGYSGSMRGEIRFEHVTFSYDGVPVLKDISFTAYPGETVAIVGQTGSGKSTLTKLVNRIYDVQAGRVMVDGVDVRDWSLNALRSQISTIEQDIFLFSRTVAENISFGVGHEVSREEVERAARDAQADGFIRKFQDGYETVIGERGVTLSGGQRQRLAIARALLTDPHILVLDDSTSAIDSATEDEIQKAIRRLLEQRTTLLITHRLSQIRWADRILVLERGTLVDQGSHDELLVRCTPYRRIFAPYLQDAVPSPAAV